MEKRVYHGSLADLHGATGSTLDRHQSMLNLTSATTEQAAPVIVDIEPSSNIQHLPPPPDLATTGSNQVNVGTPMEVPSEDRADLGYSYEQCSKARIAGSRVDAVSISLDSTFGNFITSVPENVGLLNPPGDGDVLRTFHGARSAKGDRLINQPVSFSVDPSNLSCLACEKEHPIFGADKPVTIVLSDQNFISVWPGSGTCVPILRIENSSLHELVDVFCEIFEFKRPPNGSVLLVGSASHLHRVGSSFYCREWTQIVSRLNKQWPCLRVCPLTPLIREDCPGGVARELMEVCVWFHKVYQGTVHGMKSPWDLLIGKTAGQSAGVAVLEKCETYTIPLPSSLDPTSQMVPTTICCNTSRPSLLTGMDQGPILEVLGSISSTLSRDFGMEVILENALTMGGAKEKVRKIVLIGASNLRRVESHLTSMGYMVANLCVPGWIATPNSVEIMLQNLATLNLEGGTAIVLDLFGNSVFRFIDYDGSTSKPFKQGGSWHLAGEVTVCSTQILSNLIDIALPLLKCAAGHIRIVLPPQPRYIFSGCCDNAVHCTNRTKEGFSESIVTDICKLRTHLKKTLIQKLDKNFWLADSCCALRSAGNMSSAERVRALRPFMADAVHFTADAYRNVATNIVDHIEGLSSGSLGKTPLTSRRATCDFVSGSSMFTWHGISSPVGSLLGRSAHRQQKSEKEKRHKNLGPYGRWGGGGFKRN